MNWEPGEALALAKENCAKCDGLGLVRQQPCGCVLRAIFRACYSRYLRIQTYASIATTPRLLDERFAYAPKKAGRYVFGLRNAEFAADFVLTSRRVLDLEDWRVFALHFLCAQPWRICTERLGISRGDFFHAVYRVAERLGRAFREIVPYALFPLDEYFGQVMRPAQKPPVLKLAPPRKRPVRPPLARAIARASAA